jgi:hypothetical protein
LPSNETVLAPNGQEPEPAGGPDIESARRLAEATKKNKKLVENDEPEGGAGGRLYGSHLPGVAALGMIQHLTPFLFFYRIYANALYSRFRTPEARMTQFKKDHPSIFWIHWVLDFLVQLLLVSAVVVGVALIAFNGIVHTFKLG